MTANNAVEQTVDYRGPHPGLSLGRRKRVASVVLALLVLQTGCVSTASQFLGRSVSAELTQIIGGFHSEILGVHRVGTMTWLRDGERLACDQYVDVYALERADWQIKFKAPTCALSQVKEWFDVHHGEIDSGLERMLDLLRSAYRLLSSCAISLHWR